jgi:hypothetical protein
MSDLPQAASMKRPYSPDTLLYYLRRLIQVYLWEGWKLRIVFAGARIKPTRAIESRQRITFNLFFNIHLKL